MTSSTFIPTLRQQVSVSFAYLAYSGEDLTRDPSAPAQILKMMNETLPQIPPLLDSSGKVDWQIVWGPAIYAFPRAKYQDNMMFVAQQISEPSNYVVGVRGTNSLAAWDWIDEDFEVWKKVPWRVPQGVPVQGAPMISKATNNGLNVLLNDLTPLEGIPGYPNNITSFLGSLAASGKVNLLFTGHSLAGALSPTLALWFKQSQNIAGSWDPQGSATISTVPFAGATAGDQDFANFFNERLGGACDRIYNTLDIVPHGWQTAMLKELPGLYSPAIKMNLIEKIVVWFITLTVRGYMQIETTNPITWTIQPTKKPSYLDQAGIQHTASYPTLLQVPALLTVINNGRKTPT